jgi:hypothetical protein
LRSLTDPKNRRARDFRPNIELSMRTKSRIAVTAHVRIAKRCVNLNRCLFAQ